MVNLLMQLFNFSLVLLFDLDCQEFVLGFARVFLEHMVHLPDLYLHCILLPMLLIRQVPGDLL
jgi:hypothetical protein